MRLVLLTHPPLLRSESMPRFAGMIARAMANRGHEVEVWTSPRRLGRLPVGSSSFGKWVGYVDQYLLYPRTLQRRIEGQPTSTVFVATDQALGIWIPAIARRPHVIHCHDFLALRSALGEFPQHRTSWTGRRYQQLIRRGFSRGQAFISVSQRTRDDLHRFLPRPPRVSEVVHNGLNHPFQPMSADEARTRLDPVGLSFTPQQFILHVGGNLWYKNRRGVLEIYQAYAAQVARPFPLWLVGEPPGPELRKFAQAIPKPAEVHFVPGLTNEQVNAAYSQAGVLLFPSLEEGFGWPVVEAMASGCPVVTTNIAPMTEVAGPSVRFIPRMPWRELDRGLWAGNAAAVLNEVATSTGEKRAAIVRQGLERAGRFDPERALGFYEEIYRQAAAGN